MVAFLALGKIVAGYATVCTKMVVMRESLARQQMRPAIHFARLEAAEGCLKTAKRCVWGRTHAVAKPGLWGGHKALKYEGPARDLRDTRDLRGSEKFGITRPSRSPTV